MAKTDIPAPEKIAQISETTSVWKVHLDSLRERDVNARVMEQNKFKQLSANIGASGELESLPLVTPVPGRDEFYIISGHHRTRAARQAGVMVVAVLVIERELTDDEITAKQLAHNALAGYDDADTLKRLYESIQDLDQRIASGLTDLEIKVEAPSIPSDEIDVQFEFEPVYILFMKAGHERFQEMLDKLEDDAKIYAADKEDFARYTKMINTVSKSANIRNVAGIMTKIMDIVDEHFKKGK